MTLSHWETIRASGPRQVGGKAWNMARLVRYGFNVPAGVVVPVEEYRRWLQSSGLENELLEALHLPEKRTTIITKLQSCPIDIDLTALPDGPLAIRSSAPQEDSANASFAGIHTSCLNALCLTVWCVPPKPGATSA